MNRVPITLYRPTPTSNGEGGFPTTLSSGVQIYGSVNVHDQELVCIVDRFEDVQIEDILACSDEISGDAAYYRVTHIQQPPRGRNRRATLERIDRPEFPLPPAEVTYLYVDGDALTVDGDPLFVA